MNPGDPFEVAATTWNTLMDVAKSATSFGGRQAAPVSRQATIVRVKNESGHDLTRNKVVGLDGPIFTPTQSENVFLRDVAFRASLPHLPKHLRRYAVLLDPAKDGKFARAYVSGVCQVKVDIKDTSHEFALASDGSGDHLVSSRHGHAQILWCESEDGYYGYDTGIQWALVRLGVTMSCVAIGKAFGDISPRSDTDFGSGQVDLYRSALGAIDGPIERIDVLNASADTMTYGAGIDHDKWVSVAWDADDNAWVAPLECP